MGYRIEHDSLGEVRVPDDVYWGAQTQRSHENFVIGSENIPIELIRAMALLKKAAAIVNEGYGKISREKEEAIVQAADAILAGKLDDQFPLRVWQTGSGTQTNMNVNEVITHYGNELAGKNLLHPNDDVNCSQSSNDTFPTALHIAVVTETEEKLLPSLERLVAALKKLEKENEGILKCGRTHLQDATPITFSQEISGWRAMLEADEEQIKATLPFLGRLAIGGTAVGTGLNSPEGFDVKMAEKLSELSGNSFTADPNKFHGLASKDAVAFGHGALKALAADLMKIANDVRWLASGPRLGLGEITIPANEPGSSIMPGKVNPTQCEAVTMVAVQVMGNDTAVGIGASQGNFELNVFIPVITYNYIQSLNLLADVMDSFNTKCVSGIKANKEKMHENLERSLMLVTGLSPYIGYENAAKVAHKAHEDNSTLKEACLALGFLTEEEFDRDFHPEKMIGPTKVSKL
ncbi:MAG: class II fumarate hydratase [Eubacterium sp.]|nr:class II fumarate hydratase [Eubacterium sp.]